jgi:asparagine synthase (glutamine-hydrolysing)
MCGLCGIHAPAGIADADRACVERMTAVLAHRGPDDEGRWSDPQVALGHRRLAVIDLPGGHQPMVSDDGRLALVYNGEVYDFRDLRRQLEGRGHRFRTAGDTEVILRGYEEWGDEVVARLRGMFAFALWDGRRGRLLLARDRLGVKPLYYHEGVDGRLVFASEIKALLLDPAVPRELNDARLGEYLAFRDVYGGETLFRGVRELPPGTVAVREGGSLRLREYWSTSVPAVPRHETRDRAALVERGRRMLADAVESRLVSDVPVATLNSGGLDSSVVTAIAAERHDGPLDSFCVGFADADFDERPFARVVAARAATVHHEIELSAERLEAEVDRLTWANDEPLPMSNSIGIHLICAEAKAAGITVVLSGEGADEVFGGYRGYSRVMRRASSARVPGARALARVAPPVGRLAGLRRVLHPDFLATANAFTPLPLVGELLPGGPDPLARRRELWPGGRDGGADLFGFDQRTYLQPVLQRQDRMGMAAAIEAREPMLDHRLVEWANALPGSVKLAGGATKSLLKSIAEAWLPPEIVHREKNGFAVPTGEWLLPGRPLSERVRALDDESSLVARVTDRRVVRRLVSEHGGGAADHREALWSLIALDAWARAFLGPRLRPERLPGARSAHSKVEP